MKIKSISCTQFAGIRDCNISFTDGINVLCGKNESGKSTLVNLLSRTLFQNAKIDGRTDSGFKKAYFPASRKGSNVVGDCIDGKVTIETEKGRYTLSKEWGEDARSSLSDPDGVVVRKSEDIDEILKDVLLYGEGVYSDMLFSSQRNTDISLQEILATTKKNKSIKDEITIVVSKAFAESDGISIDAIEQAIASKIAVLEGKHWDFENELPAGEYKNGLGEVHIAYNVLRNAKKVLEKISFLREAVDNAKREYMQVNEAVKEGEEELNRFNTFAGRLAVQEERRKTIERIEKELNKLRDVLDAWPAFVEAFERAEMLQKEKKSRELLDKYETAKKIADEIKELDTNTSKIECPSDEEIRWIKQAQNKITTLENKLCGMNLTTAINMLGGNMAEVVSLITGEAIDISAGVANITEAVRITVPDVMEMVISPADVDIEEIEDSIKENKEEIKTTFEKYKVGDISELETLAKTITDAKTKIDTAKSKLSILIGDTTFDELEESVKSITATVRSKEEINGDIITYCEGDVSKFVVSKGTVIDGYTKEYGSINELKAKCFDLNTELEKARESVSTVVDIPAEYLEITDTEEYRKKLNDSLTEKRGLLTSAITSKTAAISNLEKEEEMIDGDALENVEDAERVFEEQKSLLAHWKHIEKVFKEQKDKVQNNPMQDMADNFARYLSTISGGKIESEFPDADKLNMNIYSSNKLIDYEKLSEGTKETVSLAFRLAVLDHLFPDGGGVIVFDDPLTDMDVERMTQSCELIKECAKKHQVIFLTCRDEYAEILEGNKIPM